MTAFTAVFWSLAIPSILFAICADITMKLRVNDRLPEKEQFSWWVRILGQLPENTESYIPIAIGL
jgi:hypothetical protein